MKKVILKVVVVAEMATIRKNRNKIHVENDARKGGGRALKFERKMIETMIIAAICGQKSFIR